MKQKIFFILAFTATVLVNAYAANNLPPIAEDDYVLTEPSISVVIPVLNNDSDPDGNLDPASITPLTSPYHGILEVNNGMITYHPDPYVCGYDSFQYSVCDDGTPVYCSNAVVHVEMDCEGFACFYIETSSEEAANPPTPDDCCYDVSILNLMPSYFTGIYLTSQDGVTMTFDNVNTDMEVIDAGSDYIHLDPFTFYIDDSYFHLVTICLDNNSTDLQTVLVEWQDPSGNIECEEILEFNCPVEAVNDPPIAVDDIIFTGPSMSVEIDVLGNDADPNGNLDPTSITIISPPNIGSVTIGNGVVNYHPAVFICGDDSFQYSVCDTGMPVYCDTATVIIEMDWNQNPCDQISCLANEADDPPSQAKCCYDITIFNDLPDYFTGIQLTSQNGVTMSYDNVHPTMNVIGFGPDYIQVSPIASYIDDNTIQLITICLDDYGDNGLQVVQLDWINPNYEAECDENLYFSCADCATVYDDSIACDQGLTQLEFYIDNPYGTGFDVQSYHLNAISGGSFETPYVVIDPILEGESAGPFFANISPDDPSANDFCYTITVHSDDPSQNPEANCCTTETTCLPLPQCNPCDLVDAEFEADSSCTVSATLVNNYLPDHFIGVELHLSPGIYFESLDNPFGSGWDADWSTTSQSVSTITLTRDFPSDGFIGLGETALPDFSMFSYTTHEFQEIEILWLTEDGVACADTIVVECHLEETLIDCVDFAYNCSNCGPNGEFLLELEFTNTGDMAINAIQLYSLWDDIVFTENPVFFPTLAPGESYSATTVISGPDAVAGTSVCFNMSTHFYNEEDTPLDCCTPYALYCANLPVCAPATCETDTPRNDPPVPEDDHIVIGETNAPLNLVANDCDPESELQSCDISVVENPSHGFIMSSPDCSRYYIPSTGFCGTDSFTYAVCDEDGLCSKAIASITVSCELNLTASTIKHSPNPVKNSATFEYFIAEKGNATLSVFDITGKRMTTLFQDKNHPSGKHRFDWNRNGLPQGIYFYLLEVNGERLTASMVIID